MIKYHKISKNKSKWTWKYKISWSKTFSSYVWKQNRFPDLEFLGVSYFCNPSKNLSSEKIQTSTSINELEIQPFKQFMGKWRYILDFFSVLAKSQLFRFIGMHGVIYEIWVLSTNKIRRNSFFVYFITHVWLQNSSFQDFWTFFLI